MDTTTTLANRLEATTEVDMSPSNEHWSMRGFVREGVLHGRGFVCGQRLGPGAAAAARHLA
ncbi:MAG TPA: hypothetical protein VFH23_04160 [Jiangellaceae bacterium]|nr:hypothetical protein [Jiangellaceae bacterium]